MRMSKVGNAGVPSVRWETLLEGASKRTLEGAIAAFVASRRWYRTKSRRVEGARIACSFPIGAATQGGARARLAVVDVTSEGGACDSYVLPLAIVIGAEAQSLSAARPQSVVLALGDARVVDATVLEPFLVDLLATIAGGGRLTSGDCQLRFHPLPGIGQVAGVRAKPIDREQTNTSVLFGDRFVGKIVRKLDAGESPDLEVGRFLTEVGYPGSPAVAGWVDLVRGSAPPATVALLHVLVPNRGDAWQHLLESLDAFLDEATRGDAAPPRLEGDLVTRAAMAPPLDVPYAPLAEKLGRRVGEMHAALASRAADPAFSPEPLERATRARIAERTLADLARVLGMLPAHVAGAAELLARRDEIATRLARAVDLADAGAKTRVHGDLHMGQVLFTGEDFAIIDFEGEPARPLEERRAKRSPLVDVAGMLRSFSYAAASAVRARPYGASAAPWAAYFERAVAGAFLRGWLAAVGSAPIVPASADGRRALLDLFLFEKGVYEIGYEIDNRPDWVDIPLHGLRDLLGTAMATSPIDPRSPAVSAFLQGKATHAHALLGAHVRDGGGVDFAVFAPNAASVTVIGDFNAWAPDATPLVRVGDTGIFAAHVPAARAGHRYKLHIAPAGGGEAFDKADPFALASENAPGTASVVTPPPLHAWRDATWMSHRASHARLDRAMSFYEVHLGSWRRAMEQDGRMLGYREIAEPLAAHAKAMGFTHVELMPLLEHPFYGSWGYGVTGFFAATCRYGTRDDLMFLVDTLHQNGIAVVFDWVPAHFVLDAHALARFDGAPLFERATHPTWNTGLFDYARPEVRSFLLSSAEYWIETFHADGLRVDGVESMLYLDHGQLEDGRPVQAKTPYPEGVAFLRELTQTLKTTHPEVLLIAEDSSAFPGVTRSPGGEGGGGLGFDLKWDMGFSHDMRRYLSTDPLFRSSQHGVLTFRSVYADKEAYVIPLSHDEVTPAQGSLLQQVHGDPWQKLANVRLFFATAYAQTGKKLIFMGNEFAAPSPWNHDAPLEWPLAAQDPHAGVARMVKDLNAIYAREPALHERDDAPGGFEWIDGSNAQLSVIAFMRHGHDPADDVIVLCNYTPVPRTQWRVGVPHGGAWREIFNSDASAYGGSGHGNMGGVEAVPYPWNERPFSVVVTLPPLGVIYLRRG